MKDLIKRLPGMPQLLETRNRYEAEWFDWRHRVKTFGNVQPGEMLTKSESVAHAVRYEPTTSRAGRQMLRDLPIDDFSRYTFIDFGSGKGKMLLLAAEHSFRRIVGLELASDLHCIAGQNIRRYRNSGQACFNIESLNIDAAEFPFPAEDSVLYFFFPFRRPVMEPLVKRLDRSLDENPRDVIVLYRNPELADILDGMRNLKLHRRTNSYTVHRSVP
jgi:SAM-dependent methyltransferase